MVTIVDVARAAGVAPSTVSYVISGKRRISTDTRNRVEQCIRDLGYHPNAGARALASNRTNVVALAVPLRADLNLSVIMQFVSSVVTSAREHDLDLLLLTKDDGPAELRRVASSAIADALIVMDVESADGRIPMLATLDRPTVLIGLPEQPDGLSCVDLDFTAAGATCVHHLADLGHRDIALVGPSPAVYRRGTSFARRFRHGYDCAAVQRRIHTTAHPCGHSYDSAMACLDQVFAENPHVTGLVVHNEAVLPDILAGLHARGLRVPDDISVVAVCPDNMADLGAIPLTSVAIPAPEVGDLAVRMTIRQLSGPPAPEVRLLPPRLTVRRSTAVAPFAAAAPR
ncbi:LacI family DNA-binding transcriptional regulator [Kutzneria sp. CA-103260]|uniref:LacI family DNA-binding transcriptional regulator n=1 Tax=Kutzneria sp. CA-103260 TaxID=2802641 RepID=UPI001BA5ABD9|nr:LacI family DNA-binding transcriptional regulator [Kutzneria sp. CA-103260]QUQ68224.1 LacI family transcriptional regulator [Kutzneria sp. CA-103260]